MTFEEALATGRLMRQPHHQHGWKFPRVKRVGPSRHTSSPRVFIGPFVDALCQCKGGYTHESSIPPEDVNASDWMVLLDDERVETEIQKERETT